MTEQKKRGRPRKNASDLKFKAPSAKDKKRILAERNNVSDFKATLPMLPEECFDADRLDIKLQDEPDKTQKLYPPDNLSKTEKLAWLTKNRLK